MMLLNENSSTPSSSISAISPPPMIAPSTPITTV